MRKNMVVECANFTYQKIYTQLLNYHFQIRIVVSRGGIYKDEG